MSDSTRHMLDIAALAKAIETVTRHRAISMRDVAAETGISPSTLTRITQGQKPDADGLVTLLAWLKADARTFALARESACCDLHGRKCEPPSELCCADCTEADHPEHRQRTPCSSPDLSSRRHEVMGT